MTQPNNIAQFSQLLLDLYQAARELDVPRFQEGAVKILQRYIAFDSCWWGTGTQIDGHHHIHSSYILNMPDDMGELLNMTEHHNVVAQRSAAEPNRALRYSQADLYSNPATAFMSQHAGLQQVMCVSTLHPTSRLVNFLSVARHSPEPPFADDEAEWFELLMPHLSAMFNVSRVLQIAQQRTQHASMRSAMAVTDIKGILHVAEPGFEWFLQQEWPSWSGPWLPQPVLKALTEGQMEVRGEKLRAELQWIGTQVLVSVSRRSLSEDLSPQERAVATAFAAGKSYKEVARELNLAPTTVRHHLRSAYVKLGINDKGALAQALRE